MNLDIAPGFSAIEAVVATSPVGTLTGRRYPDSLIAPDKSGVQPRIGVAWRPVPGSSLVDSRRVRHLSQHVGLPVDRDAAGAAATALERLQRREHSGATRSRSRTGSPRRPGGTRNTFAVDPDFRVGSAQNWQASVQRDLPGVADRRRHVSRDQGEPVDAADAAEHISRRRRESMPRMSRGIRLPHVRRHIVAARRSDPGAAPIAQRPHRHSSVHVVEGDR